MSKGSHESIAQIAPYLAVDGMLDSRSAGYKLLAYLLAGCAILGALFLFFQSLSVGAVEQVLASRGVTTQGIVQRAYETSGSESLHHESTSPRLYLEVNYRTPGGLEDKYFEVNLGAYRSYSPGSSLQVVYDPEKPQRALLASGLNSESSGGDRLIAIALFVGGVGVALGAFLYFRRKIIILDEGLPVTGGSGSPDQDTQTHGWSSDPLSESKPPDGPI